MSIQHFDRYSYRLLFDFEDYYSSPLQTEKQKKEFSALMSNCITWKRAMSTFMKDYNRSDINKHSGLTTYIPQKKFPVLNTEYKKLKWYKATIN